MNEINLVGELLIISLLWKEYIATSQINLNRRCKYKGFYFRPEMGQKSFTMSELFVKSNVCICIHTHCTYSFTFSKGTKEMASI